MAPFVAPFDAFHERTQPTGWLEGLVKAYVGDGIAKDFYREISAYVDDDTRRRCWSRAVLEDAGQAEFAVRVVREAIEADPRDRRPAGPVGPPAASARRSRRRSAVAVERDALSALLVGGRPPGADLAELGRMFARLTDEHSRRMDRLGLSA